MGNMGAIGMAGAVEEGQISLDAALEWHLRSNHFPPVSLDWLPVCKKAIDLANADEWDIELTSGLGAPGTLTVANIVEGLHLEAFLGPQTDDADRVEFEADQEWERQLRERP